ncbi:NAD(P)-dependent alcohol dehydrogenase [Homoserinimonas sp. A520]
MSVNEASGSTSVTSRGPKTATMMAVVQHAYGSADVLGYEEVPQPIIAADQVLVQVRAAAVNHADWVYVSGRPLIARLAFGLGKPKDLVRGKDVAGVVVAVGPDVTGFRVGDEVYAEVVAGAFAEYVAIPEKLLGHKPKNLTFDQAATVPLSARTALQALRDGGKVKAGDKVLVNGASGGVGSYAVQIAKALGAEVTAVCSTRNADLVRSLGADHVIDYTAEDFTSAERGYDVILDLIGNHSLKRLRRSLSRNGILVLSSGTGSAVFGPMGSILKAMVVSPFVSQTLGVFPAVLGAEALDQLRDLVESGSVTPAIERSFPLSEVPDAIRHLVEKHARGKIVITVG